MSRGMCEWGRMRKVRGGKAESEESRRSEKRVTQRQIRTREEKDYPAHRPLTALQRDRLGQSYTLCQTLFCGLHAERVTFWKGDRNRDAKRQSTRLSFISQHTVVEQEERQNHGKEQ